MGLIEELNEVAEQIRLDNLSYTRAVAKARGVFGVEEDPYSYGKDLANVFTKIAELIKQKFIPVPLGGDGKPLEVGRRYFGSDGRAWTVLGFKPCSYDVIGECDGSINAHLKGCWLSVERPDTQERIDADKHKAFSEYWGCEDIRCNSCPAAIDGKTPAQRYGFLMSVQNCKKAMGYELALRQMKLDGRV